MTDQPEYPDRPDGVYPDPVEEPGGLSDEFAREAPVSTESPWSARPAAAFDDSPVFVEDSAYGQPPTIINGLSPDPAVPAASSIRAGASVNGISGTPPPLQGCLYCHSPGTTTLTESKPVLGVVGGGPVITCSACGAVASFEPGGAADSWRIKYRSFNRSSRFYFVMVNLGLAGWLDAATAMDLSRRGFIQRHRLQQAQYGDLSWLGPHKVDPPPPLMSPSETLYMQYNPVTLARSPSGGRLAAVLARGEGIVQDTGKLFVTDLKVHLLGQARDWSHKLNEISRVDYNERFWRLYMAETGQYYQGLNAVGQIDAQLFTVVVQHLTPH